MKKIGLLALLVLCITLILSACSKGKVSEENKYEDLAIEYEFLNAEHTTLKKEYTDLKVTNETLTEKYKSSKIDYELLIKKSKTVSNEYDELRRDLEADSGKVYSMRIENEALKEKLVKKNEEAERLLELSITRSLKYEENLSNAKTLKEVLDLYRPDLDGAHASFYSGKIFDIYNEVGASKFIETLAIEGESMYISGVIYSITSEIGLIYGNGGKIDLSIYENDVSEFLKHEGISYKEREIGYGILSNLENMKSWDMN